MSKGHRNVSLAHGNGGRLMRELIESVFRAHLGGPTLDTSADAVPVPISSEPGDYMITTDGFTVQPLEFPGGNIGSLAVHGTVNDLAVAGAEPVCLTLNAFIEEGQSFDLLERIAASLGEAAKEAGTAVIAGDTKVLPRGECGGLYLATTGVGRRGRWRNSVGDIIPGDRIIVSGSLGDHGAAVMLAREDFGWQGDLLSDSACVLPACRALWTQPGLRFLRDPTRGGLATVCNDLARETAMTVRLRQPDIPLSESVNGVCEILGFDPLYLACEGRVVAVVSPESEAAALDALKSCGVAPDPRVIGQFQNGPARVVLETELGGERILDELEDDPLPRIC